MKISAVIITKNEERNIEDCLLSLQGIADEILVVDSFSTDKTKDICKKYEVRFLEHKWEGYGAQKNWGAEQATYQYILSLDADERLSPELQKSILAVKENCLHDAYSFNRLTFYSGHPIKHCGWYPDEKVRLWNKDKGKWNLASVHENIDFVYATTLHLQGDLLHYTYQSISEHLLMADKYSALAAQEYLKKGKKPTFIKLCISPIFSFFHTYIIKLGFLDGYYGFVVSIIGAFVTFLKYAKLKELLELEN